ncbi:MAG: MaoC family dehydratase [Gammaproteobacteria bacterium]|jgi:acyl dehydratase|nr:enoyl-CoA hydratase [Chromatiales bacterium]MCP4926949.1 MaoC family dehydratase [Gammaproteobacteria bacterium]MDP7153276.1 MaoC family dehydratase [Gammaproteobacteria bacterium]MDP7296339.1 MaoC family dehydratase [Gammaproteobacteria bacterium]MDP7419898.1 MaoC family dehydratase [Gammaproteobacteria bacterium]
MALIIDTIENAKALEGKEIGVSEWYLIDQDRINRFAEATDDHQWIHVDVERAKRELPVGSTIAHGYLLTALFPALAEKIVIFNGERAINYGLNKVRFKQMVPAGSRVRLRSILKSARKRAGALQIILESTMEVEGQSKPACVAETIALYFV